MRIRQQRRYIACIVLVLLAVHAGVDSLCLNLTVDQLLKIGQGKKGPCENLVNLPLLGLLQAHLFCSVR